MSRSSAILLIGYRRPDFVIERLRELEKFKNLPVYISIDFHPELVEVYRTIKSSFSKYNWILRSSNLGLAKHLCIAVSEVLELHDNCVIIEDDVSSSFNSISSLLEILEERLPSNILTVGLFGGLPRLKLIEIIFKNRWRETPYFTPWLWAIQREDWLHYSLFIVRDYQLERRELLQARLGNKGVKFWLPRLEKVNLTPDFTWDYQMFYLGILEGKKHLLPTFRSADNLGLGDPLATNTVHKFPLWYVGKRSDSKMDPQKRVRNSILLSLLQKIDSLTWAGDSSLILKIRRIRKSLFFRRGQR